MAVSGMSVFMVTAPFAARATAPPNTNADTPSLFEGTNDGTQMELSCVAQAVRPQPSVAEKANFWPTITKPNAPPCGKRSGQRGDSTSPAVGRRLCYRTRRPCLARRLMLARGAVSDLGRARLDAGFFLDCATARKRESGYSVCADALSAASSPGERRRLMVGRTQPRTRCRGFFCETRLFHWNADVVPLCCRKAATNGRRPREPAPTDRPAWPL